VVTKMQFILRGFSQDSIFRLFVFEGVRADRTRSAFTVKADVGLARKYGIRLQDLPLLCREVLERSEEGPDTRVVTYTEADMCTYAEGNAARSLAAQKKKAPRRPAPGNLGTAWRALPR
jgi:hypothetical protein